MGSLMQTGALKQPHWRSQRITLPPGLIQWALLLLWTGIGAALRWGQLTLKAPWTDEFATLVFSLGNRFTTVPLDQWIDLDQLLAPLYANPAATPQTVVRSLLTDDVHPPLYFVLAHLWLGWFPTSDGLISLWGARSLAALWGTLAIPAMYGLGWLAARSTTVAQVAALLMAVSPLGIFLAQEARHYTLGILWVIASLACSIAAWRSLQTQIPIAYRTVALWIAVNTLGLATHFFMVLTLITEAGVLAGLAWGWRGNSGRPQLSQPWRSPVWWRIFGAIAGTLMGLAVWLPFWLDIRQREIVQWIQVADPLSLAALINPPFQALAAWVTMVILLPIESSFLPLAIASGTLMVIFVLWLGWWLQRGYRRLLQTQADRAVMVGLGGFVVGAIALFFVITYGFGTDLTRGARYTFVYFPAVLLVVALSFVSLAPRRPLTGWDLMHTGAGRAIAVLGIVGVLSGLTVINNLGYRKYYRPDLLVPVMLSTSTEPMLIATTQATLVEIGELMGLGWQWQEQARDRPPQFLLAHNPGLPCAQDCPATTSLTMALDAIAPAVDLWLVNFEAPIALDAARCQVQPTALPFVHGYDYEWWHCEARDRPPTPKPLNIAS